MEADAEITKPDISVWKAFSKQRRNAAEKERQKILGQVKNALRVLSDKYKWDSLFIFGSLISKGNFSDGSDVDIGVSGLNKFDHYKFIADFSMLVDREADVVRLEDCRFADAISERAVPWTKNGL
jgi:predicted nucleotidyltransferase